VAGGDCYCALGVQNSVKPKMVGLRGFEPPIRQGPCKIAAQGLFKGIYGFYDIDIHGRYSYFYSYMASVWRHPNSRYWTGCYTDANGKQLKRSTKLTDRGKALKVAQGWEQEYRNVRAEEQTRKVFAEIRRDIHGATNFDQSVEQFLEEWLERKKNEISQATWLKYVQATRDFCQWLGEAKEKDLSIITPTVIRQWRDHLASRLAPKTVNNMLRVLSVALAHAESSEQIERNPVAKVKSVKRDEVKRSAFTIPQVKSLLKVSNDEWRGMILAGLYTGQRLRDIATLKWSAIDLNERMLSIITSKTRRTVSIPIATPLYKYLKALPSPIEPSLSVFPVADTTVTAQDRTSSLSNQFHSIMVAAGLAEKRSKAKTGRGHSTRRERGGLSFHCLRHTATSLLKNAGVSEAVAMDIIGHDSAAISIHYTHIEDDAKRRAIEKLPDISL